MPLSPTGTSVSLLQWEQFIEGVVVSGALYEKYNPNIQAFMRLVKQFSFQARITAPFDPFSMLLLICLLHFSASMVRFCSLSRISRTDLRHMVTDAGFFQDVRLSCLSLRDTGVEEIGWLDTPSSLGLTTKPFFPYLQMGAWKRSFWLPPSPVSCPAFVVWQNNKPRVVIDLRRVNAKPKTG